MDVLIQGVLLGGLYALFALGLSLMFGVLRLVNVAHGDFIILAAFAALSMVAAGAAPVLALVLVVPLTAGVGYALQRYVLNNTLGKDPMPSLVVTFGLSIVIQNLLQEIYSADPRSLETGGFNTQSWAVTPDFSVGVLPVVILLVALVATAGLQWLFQSTALGRSFRAVSDDGEVAQLMGLKARKVYAQATALAFALMSVAGVMQAMRTTVSPADGPLLLIFAFEAVIIGGMGSFWGTLVGALLLGITQQVGFRLDPGWGIWAGHLAFLVLLVIRPQGLFPKTIG